MNRSFDNIEYRPFFGHKYRVGYAPLSGIWHVFQCSDRTYRASCTTNRGGLGYFFADTLAEVSKELRVR